MKFFKSLRVTLLRPQILSKALAGVWALFVLFVTVVAIVSSESSRLIKLFELIYTGYAPTFWGLILGLIWAIFYGYLTGFLIGYIYSKLVIRKVDRDATFAFEIDFDKRVNLIQKGAEGKAYTIVFVANPAILNITTNNHIPDPIIANKTLFYKVVMRCMRSFAHNELLRLPEIQSRLRLITIFDETRKDPTNPDNVLCQNIDDLATVIAPRKDVGMIKKYVEETRSDHDEVDEIDLQTVDVVYLISASEDLTRSAARFTEDDNARGGEDFTFTFQDPFTLDPMAPTPETKHASFANLPGAIALSAWDDREKVPIHEFAHAMSSVNNGVIYDEYVDKYHTGEIEPDAPPGLTLFINRKRRRNAYEPVPDVFAKYEFNGKEVVYFSDRYRNDKAADWTSFVPEKEDIDSSCTMDFTYFRYLFDKLIFDFMYDRLMVKMKRN